MNVCFLNVNEKKIFKKLDFLKILFYFFSKINMEKKLDFFKYQKTNFKIIVQNKNGT